MVQIWLLKKRMVVELHTYVYLCIPAPAGAETASVPNTGELQVGVPSILLKEHHLFTPCSIPGRRGNTRL